MTDDPTGPVPDQAPPPLTARAMWDGHPGALQAWALNIAGAGWFGVTGIALDGPRFGAPTFDGLRASLGITGWSTLLAVYAVALVALRGSLARTVQAVLVAGSVLYLSIAVYFVVGLPDPHAAPWGPGAFLVLGLWQLTQAEGYRQARHAATREHPR